MAYASITALNATVFGLAYGLKRFVSSLSSEDWSSLDESGGNMDFRTASARRAASGWPDLAHVSMALAIMKTNEKLRDMGKEQ